MSRKQIKKKDVRQISKSYPGGIESDNDLARFKCLHHPGDQVHVGISGNVCLKAHVAELFLWGDVNGGIVTNTETVIRNMFLGKKIL